MRIFRFVALSVFVLYSSIAFSQDDPVAYMSRLSAMEEVLSKNYLSYMSEVAHGRRARKMEKRRVELIGTIKESIRETGKIKPYKGDATLRDSFKNYWNVLLSVFTEDYAKIVDMEEVAERSYDAMEAYLLTQEKASEKLEQAHEQVRKDYELFAGKNNIQLREGQSKLNKRLNDLGNANLYMNQMFLIFFKSSVQESLLIEALNKNDINGVEQLKSSMARYASEGLLKLDSIKPYKNDGSLITACRKVLEFQKSEAEKFTVLTDYMVKRDDFDKVKKSYDAKAPNKRTQADVDNFNQAVKDQNASITTFNKTNQELNSGREKVMTNWENARKRFMDYHFPHKV